MSLTHELTVDGFPGPHFGYGPVCPVDVPGSGAQAFMLRSWPAVLAALRDPAIRDLRAVGHEHAVASVTLQHDHGLLRRSTPETDIRQVLNPLFTTAAAERWRPDVREFALSRAQDIPAGRHDLATAFCRPFIGDVVTRTAGLADGEWPVLASLSDRTTGRLVLAPEDHAGIKDAWAELYDWCDQVISRLRRHGGDSVMAQVVAALDRTGRPADEIRHVCATVFNGFPTAVSIMIVLTEHFLRHPAADRVKAIRETLRLRAHFTFALPGVARRDMIIDGCPIRRGSVVLPIIHAAEMDPRRTPDPGRFDPGRPTRAILAFGAGVHVCLGRALSLLAFDEGLAALRQVHPGLRLAATPVRWLEGTTPTPAEIPVILPGTDDREPALLAGALSPHSSAPPGRRRPGPGEAAVRNRRREIRSLRPAWPAAHETMPDI